METNGRKLTSQRQETQPGEEGAMHPPPQSFNPAYKPSNKLRGKVALVTGGDSGIGRAVCLYFAYEGATVVFTYLKTDEEERDSDETLRMLEDAAKSIEMETPIAIAADLGYDENCRRVVEEVVNRYGRIDILVNNAAEQHLTKSLEEITEERLHRTFRTNTFSCFFLIRHALKYMKEGSSIINSTSVDAYAGDPTLLDYSSSKGAVVALTRALALQLAPKGIRVNGVASGFVWTPLPVSSLDEDKIKSFGSNTPMGRAAQPSEIAPCYVFLACNHCSSYYSGQMLHPNGGMVVNT